MNFFGTLLNGIKLERDTVEVYTAPNGTQFDYAAISRAWRINARSIDAEMPRKNSLGLWQFERGYDG